MENRKEGMGLGRKEERKMTENKVKGKKDGIKKQGKIIREN